MLSLAKDSLKQSKNLYIYKKSSAYIPSLSLNSVQRFNGSKNVISRSNDVTLNSKSTNQELLLKSDLESSRLQTISDRQSLRLSTQSTYCNRSADREFKKNTIDMLLTSICKTTVVEKHGTSLPKTMRHLKSLNLLAFRNTLENHSTLSNSGLNRIVKIEPYKKYKTLNPGLSPREKLPGENNRRTRFLLTESMKSPFMTCSNAFHTSTVSPIYTNVLNRVSFNDKIDRNTSNQEKLSTDDEEYFEKHCEGLRKKFDLSNERFDTLSNKRSSDFQNDSSETETHRQTRNSVEIGKSGESIGRRHSKKKVHAVSSDRHSEDGSTEISNIDTFNHEKMEKLFPEPRNAINKIYSIISSELKDLKYMVKPSYVTVQERKKTKMWQTTYKVLWPSEMSFSATAKSKTAAAHTAALKCLHYLTAIGKVKNGLPAVYDSNVIKDILNKPVKIEVQEHTIYKINQLLEWYNKDIAQLIQTPEPNKAGRTAEIDLVDSSEDIYEGGMIPADNEFLVSTKISDPLRGTPLIEHSSEALNKRDIDMFQNLAQRKDKSQKKLPITDYREDIIKQLEDERVLVVKGEPGCGKSTQLPQFILDHFTKKGKATDCNIIITQPRRISAISLAKRVADERNEQLGESIGYQVRLQSVLPSGPSGGVLFCSTGILLRRLQSNPTLIGCSHVILDEAHERDLNTDILIVLLSRALQKNPNLKLVIMSATINAGLFERYFNCNTINVPGFTYPVKMHFLEDIHKLGVQGITNHDMSLANPYVNTEQMALLVRWISKNKPDGAILCFLPGWSEIQKMKRHLEEILSPRTHMIFPVHSRLPHSEQIMIFNRAPQGVRKIILATNIAETSITIDDVVYVVDSCAHKEVRLQHDTGRSSIDNQWISRGNISQRKGRAGRVQPGESFHFITKEKFNTLDEFPTPEIMRAELQKAVLDCKTYTSEKVAEFFAQMPEPPSTLAVEYAVTELLEIGALDDNENLTALGKRIALFPIDPRLSKAMVYSAIFQCVNPIVTMTSILSSDFEIFSDRLYDKSPVRKMKQQFEPASDHLAIAWLFEEWNSHANNGQYQAQKFCRNAQLQFGKMMLLRDLRNLYAQHLSQCRMVRPNEQWQDLNSSINKFSNQDELVRGVLLAGLDRILQKKDGEFKNGRFKKVKNVMMMQDGHRATLTPDSVNYNRENWPTPYLTYQRHVHSTERRTTLIRESSLVSPLTVLMFCRGDIEMRKYQRNSDENNDVLLTLQGKKNVKIICDPETAQTLLDLRDLMQNVVRYFIENQGLSGSDRNMSSINSFKHRLIQLLNSMLNEGNKEINNARESKSENEDDEWI